MKALEVITVGLVAGLVSAGVSWFVASRSSPESAESAALAPGDPSGDGPSRAELDRLRKSLEALAARVDALPTAPSGGVRTPLASSELEALRDELFGRLDELEPAASSLASSSAERAFQERVARALGEIQIEQRLLAEDSGFETAPLDKQLDQLAAWLELDESQLERVGEILAQRRERRSEVQRMWAGGADSSLLEDTRRANRSEFVAAMTAALFPEQATLFAAKFVPRFEAD